MSQIGLAGTIIIIDKSTRQMKADVTDGKGISSTVQ